MHLLQINYKLFEHKDYFLLISASHMSKRVPGAK